MDLIICFSTLGIFLIFLIFHTNKIDYEMKRLKDRIMLCETDISNLMGKTIYFLVA